MLTHDFMELNTESTGKWDEQTPPVNSGDYNKDTWIKTQHEESKKPETQFQEEAYEVVATT